MVPRFNRLMTDEELLTARIRQISKMPEDVARARETLHKSRFQSAQKFEEKFGRRIRRTSYLPGDLVLIRNNPIENTVAIKKKTHDRYIGPYRVVRRTKGGSYVLEELNGNVLRTSAAAYRLIPYVRREHLDGWARLIEAWDETRSDADGSQDESGTEEDNNEGKTANDT